MTVALETGNAAQAAAATRGWFVGDLVAWAAQRGESFDPASTPRHTDRLQVKWLSHPAGDVRAAWAPPDDHFSLGVLVDGDMCFDLRALDGAERSIHLAQPGDYVLWHGPSYAHSWHSDGGCTILTIRWPVHLPSDHADLARQRSPR